MSAGRVVLVCVGCGHEDVPENTTPALGVFIEAESLGPGPSTGDLLQEVRLHVG